MQVKNIARWVLSIAFCLLLSNPASAQVDAPAADSHIPDGAKAPLAVDSSPLYSESIQPPEALDLESVYDPSPRVYSYNPVPSLPMNGDLPVAKINENLDVVFGDWLGYNSTQSDSTWLVGKGDDFGIYSIESFPALGLGKDSSLMLGVGIHFLNGPVVTDMPPRLYDFQAAYQWRKTVTPSLILDTRVGIGAFSDFEGSARKGIRFPGHAVAYYQWDEWLVSLLGVEVLDRDDISVLPVFGMVWRPREDIVAELVYPRPRLQLRMGQKRALYIGGELGGGTWAIERVDGLDDNATYRDLRLMVGMQEFGKKNRGESAMEFGCAFARTLEYRSGIGNYNPEDAFIIRFRQHY